MGDQNYNMKNLVAIARGIFMSKLTGSSADLPKNRLDGPYFIIHAGESTSTSKPSQLRATLSR